MEPRAQGQCLHGSSPGLQPGSRSAAQRVGCWLVGWLVGYRQNSFRRAGPTADPIESHFPRYRLRISHLPGWGTTLISGTDGKGSFVSDMLSLSAHLPVVEVDAGTVIVSEGGESTSIWILMSGSLRVFKGDVSVNTVTVPGAIIGEVSLLLGVAHGATVVAMEPSRFRFAADGNALIFSDPQITRLIAVGFGRASSNFLTTYLADVKEQYGGAAGLSIVSDVLAELAHRQAPPARPGSARDPNPDY